MGRRADLTHGKAGAPERASPRGEAHPPPPAALALDTVIHERARLGIVSALAVHERLCFSDLRALLSLTDGNLSVHARRLEEAGYLAVEKSFQGRVPRTDFRLTVSGRAALSRYLAAMEGLVRSLRRAER